MLSFWGNKLVEYFSTPIESASQALIDNVRQNAPAVFGTCLLLGAGAIYTMRNTKVEKAEKPSIKPLIEAITHSDVNHTNEKVIKWIDEIDVSELNQPDENGLTPLIYAISVKNKTIISHLLEKFLEHQVAVNTLMPNGQSIFTRPHLARFLLSAINSRYNTYACFNAGHFFTSFHPDAYSSEIIERKGNWSIDRFEEKLSEIQEEDLKICQKTIKRQAKFVDKSKMGSNSTFASAIADKLLCLFPEQRIKILRSDDARDYQHFYVVMSHTHEDWEYHDEWKLELPKAFDNAFVIDPWLASLGWDDGVFSLTQYLEHDQNKTFLYNAQCLFDTGLDKPDTAIRPSIARGTP